MQLVLVNGSLDVTASISHTTLCPSALQEALFRVCVYVCTYPPIFTNDD